MSTLTRARNLTPEQVWIARLFRAACADEKTLTKLENPSESHRETTGEKRKPSPCSVEDAIRRIRKELDALEKQLKEYQTPKQPVHTG